jgi:hypothetical protein
VGIYRRLFFSFSLPTFFALSVSIHQPDMPSARHADKIGVRYFISWHVVVTYIPPPSSLQVRFYSAQIAVLCSTCHEEKEQL